MRIALVNRNYFVTGGPERYLFSLVERMPQHTFIPFAVNFKKNFKTPYQKYFVSPPGDGDGVYIQDFKLSLTQKISYAFQSIYHLEAKKKLEWLIRAERPDLALFLNAVYFSDSIIDACRKYRIPILWRISDFHKVCANYLLYRDGHVCEDCLNHGILKALRNRCGGYQRSFGAAFIKVIGTGLSKVRGLYEAVDYFIVPSEFTRQKMIQGGFDPKKLVHIPTGVTLVEQDSIAPPTSPDILYFGRLIQDKGVETLLSAFTLIDHPTAQLWIAGDDNSSYARELKEKFSGKIRERIHFLGFLPPDRILRLLKLATCFVVPSLCYDNQPNVLLEGMAHGRPSVVSNLGSLKEVVKDGQTGLLFEAGDPEDLARKLDYLLSHPQEAYEMGIRARQYVARHHSIERHLASLEALFEKCRRGN